MPTDPIMRDIPEASEPNSNSSSNTNECRSARADDLHACDSDASLAERYLAALPLPAERRHAWLARIEELKDARSTRSEIQALHGLLARSDVDSDDPATASIAERLAMAASMRPAALAEEAVASGAGTLPHIATMPPVKRASVAPMRWSRGFFAYPLG